MRRAAGVWLISHGLGGGETVHKQAGFYTSSLQGGSLGATPGAVGFFQRMLQQQDQTGAEG